MWLVNPKILCRKHLLGEHVELHMFVGTINKKKKIQGYIDNDLIEPSVLQGRHYQLSKEMEDRGYIHNSPLAEIYYENLTIEQMNYTINKENALKELLNRCSECRKNFKTISKNNQG